MYNSVDFRLFTNVVQITPLSDSRTFTSPLKETSCPLAVSLTSPLPHLLAMTNLFLVSMDFPVLNISYIWSHIIMVICVWLLSLQQSIFKVYPRCSMTSVHNSFLCLNNAPKSLQMVIAAMKLKDAYPFGMKVMTNLDSIFKSRDITLPTKIRLVKAMVFPVVMYGCESWTVKKADR